MDSSELNGNDFCDVNNSTGLVIKQENAETSNSVEISSDAPRSTNKRKSLSSAEKRTKSVEKGDGASRQSVKQKKSHSENAKSRKNSLQDNRGKMKNAHTSKASEPNRNVAGLTSYQKLEGKMIAWINDLQRDNSSFLISVLDLKNKAKAFAKELRVSDFESSGWFDQFKAKNSHVVSQGIITLKTTYFILCVLHFPDNQLVHYICTLNKSFHTDVNFPIIFIKPSFFFKKKFKLIFWN